MPHFTFSYFPSLALPVPRGGAFRLTGYWVSLGASQRWSTRF